MPVFDTSRTTRLVDKEMEHRQRKTAWASKEQEPVFGVKKVGMADVVKAYRAARTPAERAKIIEANGADYMLKALGRHGAPLPGLGEDDDVSGR